MKTIKEIETEVSAYTSMDEISTSIHAGDDRKGVIRLLEKHRRRLRSEQAQKDKYSAMSRYENSLRGEVRHIAGIDEAGRGPIAGEVVAAAVILPEGFYLPGLDDSKKLSLKKRLAFREIIMEQADYGIGIASVREIDELNIYQASRLAMKRAVENLDAVPGHLLVDAMTLDTGIPETSIIRGDANSVSIAAASVIAKTERDMMMAAYDSSYPGYGFGGHKGYGTKDHLEALHTLGASEIHRQTFEPVKSILFSR
ncbi:ribonuclease HII [Salinicoccus sp. ID82-1]|uniref:Ribonuclease HII n=1 Tax=Salinicoccus cyprini TaxID=2493691 RepID=A0A558AY50_9STAP|nr:MULTISPECIES: ribonuclease HII [Salinicoccus]MCG1008711.1 ribonuclease HII [Salinicoccus sp. ID82-1]TVT29186.1 ribonuclease HII [Salinicoccus cyprini]